MVLPKTSCYTFSGRLLEKGAITDVIPNTLKPVFQEEALKEQQESYQKIVSRIDNQCM